ncbi:MAG: peptide-modifying radical SAM enzyme CbpB [Kiritimatiellia bacterium]|jgi:uncharacterized protein
MSSTFNSQTHVAAPSRGRYVNSGNGPAFAPVDIGHPAYMALVQADTAFWALIRKNKLAEALSSPAFIRAFRREEKKFAREMHTLRFGLKPSAVYFNPTEKCNLNCRYCYIPAAMRRNGEHMSAMQVLRALALLKKYFRATLPSGSLPQIVFHGAEPMLNREAVFAGIERYAGDFRFGVQTNGTLLDDRAIAFLTGHGVGIGLSLDGPKPQIADRTRQSWDGHGVFAQVKEAMTKLAGYPGYNVICTVTSENMRHLTSMVEFLHAMKAPACMLNIVRCTLPPARKVRPDDASAAGYFLAALKRSNELYRRTGRKLVVANFANIVVSIVAPAARRLMCDISPCGGGRCFFALAPNGDIFPCSEFIGLDHFTGGNLFRDPMDKILESAAFKEVTGRLVENIEPCRHCAIRHFCGAPCPAEAHEVNGGMDRIGSFCEFYEEQVRYAFRIVADGREDEYLWDNWKNGTTPTFHLRGVLN